MKHPHDIIIYVHQSYPFWSVNHVIDFLCPVMVGIVAVMVNMIMYRERKKIERDNTSKTG